MMTLKNKVAAEFFCFFRGKNFEKKKAKKHPVIFFRVVVLLCRSREYL